MSVRMKKAPNTGVKFIVRAELLDLCYRLLNHNVIQGSKPSVVQGAKPLYRARNLLLYRLLNSVVSGAKPFVV